MRPAPAVVIFAFAPENMDNRATFSRAATATNCSACGSRAIGRSQRSVTSAPVPPGSKLLLSEGDLSELGQALSAQRPGPAKTQGSEGEDDSKLGSGSA